MARRAAAPRAPDAAPGRGIPWRLLEGAAVLLLAAIAVLSVRSHARGDSPTFDETYHLYAGAASLEEGTYFLNLEHPPLMKLLAAAALRPLHVSAPSGDPIPRGLPADPRDYVAWLYRNAAPADALVDAGRRPFAFLLALLVVVVFLVARALGGPGAGLLAAGIVAFDPNLVAHAGVIHTDVGASLGFLATVALGLAAARTGRWRHWLAAGAALGLALVTKFTAVLLVPVLFGLVLLARRRPVPGPPPLLRSLAGVLLACAVALGAVRATYGYAMRGMPDTDARARVASFLEDRGAPPAAVARFSTLSSLSPPLGHFAAGVAGVVLYGGKAHAPAYLHGRISEKGFPSYFLVAFLLKSTPALLALLAAALLLGGRALASAEVLALLGAAGLLFLSTLGSSFNIGVRHVLPAVPLLAVAGAVLLARRLPGKVFAAAAALLVASAGASLAAIHPHELAYFNALAGGPENGAAWLVDSNLDWGQDVKRLAALLRERGIESETTILASSGLVPNFFSPRARTLRPGETAAPGYVAFSANVEKLGAPYVEMAFSPGLAPSVLRTLEEVRRRGRPVARAGYSITLWELPPGGTAPR